AARVSSDEVTPLAISLIVRTEQGAMIMPRVGNEPEAIGAPTSAGRWLAAALADTAARSSAVSAAMVSAAARETTRWLATPSSRQASSTRTPSIAPEAPEMPTTIGNGGRGGPFSRPGSRIASPLRQPSGRPAFGRHRPQPYVI